MIFTHKNVLKEEWMMKSERGKKEWSRPELTVLTRNKPEEAVLGNCKGVGGSGYDSAYGSCMYDLACNDCNVQGAS